VPFEIRDPLRLAYRNIFDGMTVSNANWITLVFTHAHAHTHTLRERERDREREREREREETES
jgi:hypothetical protein